MDRKTIENLCKKNWLKFELYWKQHDSTWQYYELKIFDDRAIDWRTRVSVAFDETFEKLQWKIDEIKKWNFNLYH